MVQLNQSFSVQTEQLFSCPNCQSKILKNWCRSPERSLRLSPQIFTYSQCQTCQLIFLSERPLESEIQKFYPDSYQPYQSVSSQLKNIDHQPDIEYSLKYYLKKIKTEIETYLLRPLVKEIERVYTPNQPNSSLLDFGCGSEKFLNHARNLGWKTIGLDFSEKVVKKVHNNGHQSFLMSSNVWEKIENESLQFVRMSHVLEHLYNPLDVLKNLYMKMSSNSTLHISMPNAYGVSARMFRSYWWGLECPRHITFYSPKILKQQLHQLGFENINIFYENITKDMVRSIGYIMYERNLIKHETIDTLVSNYLLKILLFFPSCFASIFQISDRFHLIAKRDKFMKPIIAWKPKLGKINKWKIASARLRCLLPCQYLQKVGYPCEIFNAKHLDNYQLVIFQKLHDHKNLTLAKSLKSKGIKLAFDLCDNIFYNPNNLFELNQKIEPLTEMLNCVDMVTVSTPELGKVIQEKTNKPYFVIDDAVEQINCHPITKIYSKIHQLFAFDKNSLKIIWYGNAGSETMPVGIKSLTKIIPDLELLHQKIPITLTIISNSKTLVNKYIQTNSFSIKYYSWNPLTFPALFQQQDICIIPVEINPYTICKTNNRLVLSLLFGVPVIADLIPSYIEFKDYILSSDWINNLLIYAKNLELRQYHIQQGQAYIQSKYTPEYTISQWSTLFKKIIILVNNMTQNYRILVVTRANAIHDGQTLYFQNLDGVYLDSIAAKCQKMTLLTPIYYKEKDEMYEIFKNYTYQFTSDNLTFVNIPDYKNQNYNLLSAITRLPKQFLLSLREIFRHNIIFVMMPTHRAVFTAIAGRFLRKKVLVYSGNDWFLDLETTFKWKGWIKNYLFFPYQKACELLEKLAMLSAHTRLLNGASLLQKYQNYPGLTIQTLPLINLNKNDLYKRNNTCQNSTIQLLCVASIQKRKGIEYLIQAFAQLLTRYPNLRLKLVGGLTQPYTEEMTTLCHDLKIQNQVTFTGYITNGTELVKLYQESDIFILPSLSEGFPRVLFEAMSQSLPIITTNIFNIFNRLNDSGIVYYVQPANVESLFAGIETLILNSELRQSLIEKGFQYVQQLLNQNPSQQVLDSLKTFEQSIGGNYAIRNH